MHRGLIIPLGLEAAEVRYRGRAFRNGTIDSPGSDSATYVVKESKLIAEHRLGRSRRRYRVRKDGRLASKNSSIQVCIEGEHHVILLPSSTWVVLIIRHMNRQDLAGRKYG